MPDTYPIKCRILRGDEPTPLVIHPHGEAMWRAIGMHMALTSGSLDEGEMHKLIAMLSFRIARLELRDQWRLW